ncbi:hypothetical protein ACFWZ2_39960 [Streptomyces sp. NPDC059002]|uniref:hypothetical protein n=1 Tax=Streptomyces sp. NPDC059002 TaxID=3346690 RepID=UPI0036A5472F
MGSLAEELQRLEAEARERVEQLREKIAELTGQLSVTEERVMRRLDITGSRWSVPGAEAVLTLWAVISNGDLPEYWAFHIERERERLYPHTDQHNYELTA